MLLKARILNKVITVLESVSSSTHQNSSTPADGGVSLADLARAWRSSLLHCRVGRRVASADAGEPQAEAGGGQEGHPTPLILESSGKGKSDMPQRKGLVYSANRQRAIAEAVEAWGNVEPFPMGAAAEPYFSEAECEEIRAEWRRRRA